MSLISVIVPIYNVEKYLDKCIESIVNQTYKNLEIILVDDGSPDNCPEICDKWAEKDNRIKVVHKENGGAGSARNAGLEASSGEWIGFVDGDDSIDEDFYEALLDKSNDGYYDVVACGFKYISKDETRLSDNYYNEEHVFTKDELLTEYFDFCKSQWVSFCNKIIKKNCLIILNFPRADILRIGHWHRWFITMPIKSFIFPNTNTIILSVRAVQCVPKPLSVI